MYRLCAMAALFSVLLITNISELQAQISGAVFDAATGRPIYDANIMVPETTVGASSSRTGTFILQWHTFPIRVEISAVGYEPEIVTVFESTSMLHVTLSPKVYIHEEVMVENRRIDVANSRTRPIPVTSIDVQGSAGRQDASSVDLLRSEKGVYIQQTTPGQGSVYIRGRAGRDVLYLFNGLRMNPSFVRSGQNQYFGAIDPFTTRQINVFRGPVSVYYGSDALSGGVDVTPVIRSFSARNTWEGGMVTQGNFGGTGERTLHTHTSYKSPMVTWYLAGTARHFSYYRMSNQSESEQWFPYTTRIENADYNHLSYTTSLRYRINDRNQLTMVSFAGVIPDAPRIDRMIMGYSRQVEPDRTAPDLAYGSNTSPLLFSAHSVALSSSIQRSWLASANIRMGYHRLKDHRREIPFETAPNLETGETFFTQSTVTNYDENTSDQLLLSFDLLSTPTLTTLIRMGGDVSYDMVSSSRYRTDNTAAMPRQERLPRYPDGSIYMQSGLFLHANQHLTESIWLEGGMRFSYINAQLELEGIQSERGFDPFASSFTATTGSFGFTWAPISHLYFTANASSGFRAPNVADLSELGERRSRFLQVPNPDLRPERTMNLDVSVRWINEVVNAEITGYRVQYSDKIESAPTGVIIPLTDGRSLIETTNRNENSMQLWGIESSLDVKINTQLSTGFVFNYTFGELKERDGRITPVDRIPPANGRAYIRFELAEGLNLSLQSRFALSHVRLADAERQDFRINNEGTDGFIIVQLVSNWQLNEQSSVRLFADNLLDTPYREHASALDGLGRNVTVRYSFTF